MSELLDKQFAHTSRKARLILYAESCGYQLKETYSLRCEDCKVGHKKSLHKSNLASDFVLFIGGVMLSVDQATIAHNKLHDYWDTMGGAERIKQDLGHYSTAHWGMR